MTLTPALSLFAMLPCVAAAAGVAASSPESLYVLSAHVAPAEDGKSLTMTVRETQRTPDFSLVDVEYVCGGSASSLFMVRGFCGLMRAREQKLAIAEQVSEKPIRFQITFPKVARVEDASRLPRMVLSEADCARVGQGPP